MELTYTKCGDYLIPDLVLLDTKEYHIVWTLLMPHDQMFPKWKHLMYRHGITSSPSCGSFLVLSIRCSAPAERTSYNDTPVP